MIATRATPRTGPRKKEGGERISDQKKWRGETNRQLGQNKNKKGKEKKKEPEKVRGKPQEE